MSALLIIFLLALAVTVLGTPVIRRFAIAIDFVDAPAGRKLHSTPMPLMGGVAIFGGAVLAFLYFFTQFNMVSVWREAVGILLSISLIALTGLIDDRVGLRARYKLLGQAIGVAILIWFGIYVHLPIPLWANYLITFFWVVGISNAINFLDNMDGLSAGVSGVAAAFITLHAANNGQYLVASLAAAILGACLGFLRYNFKPAVIFMGDAGALFLGFLLAVLAIQLRFPTNTNLVTWLVPIFVLGMPLFDTSLVIVSRSRRGVNPFTTAGKDHTSHRLVDLGLGQREAVLVLYLISGIFGMVSLFVARSTFIDAYVIALIVFTLAGYCIFSFERWRDQNASAQK